MYKLFLATVLITATLHNSPAQAAGLSTVISCDNGAAIFQINTDERRNFQFVIKDPRIALYLDSTGAFRNGGRNFGNGSELILGGYNERGIFSAEDLQIVTGNYNSSDSFELERTGSALKLSLGRVSVESYCEGTRGDSGSCSGAFRTVRKKAEYGNWAFRSCEVI